MTKEEQDVAFAIFWGVVFVLLLVGGWVLKSSLEAEAYNHVTGKNVSTWDAMFLDLRVQSEPK